MKLKKKKDNLTGLILADGLITDYEFAMRIHNIAHNEDMNEYMLKKSLVYSGYFEG